MSMRRKTGALVAVLAVGLATFGVGASFASAQSDNAKSGQAQSAPDRDAAAESGATFGNLTLTVNVDERYCLSGGVQCSTPAGSGHTFAAAASTNHNPVRLVAQVLSGAAPVNGLPTGSFNVFTGFVPAGGSAPVKFTTCTSCFQSAGSGVYAFFVHPGSGNWKSGTYHVQVQVTSGGVVNRALARIDIP